MRNKFKKKQSPCAEYREALEELHAGLGQVEGAAELQRILSAELLGHAESCASCGEAAEIFWDSRNLLSSRSAVMGVEAVQSAASTAWFSTRVMARIVEREGAVRAAGAEWSVAVTRMASRLAWVSAIALVVAGTLVYDREPLRESGTIVSQASPEAPQYLFEGATPPANVDDALAGPVER